MPLPALFSPLPDALGSHPHASQESTASQPDGAKPQTRQQPDGRRGAALANNKSIARVQQINLFCTVK